MTRINSAIHPKNLTDQHLIAELRELPRIFTAVEKRLERGKLFNDIPDKFTLGAGHCRFFYNKLAFLDVRYLKLIMEYQIRYNRKGDWGNSYSTKFLKTDSRDYNKELYRNYQSTESEKQLLIERISTRINESNQIPRYYGEKITKEQAIKILNQS